MRRELKILGLIVALVLMLVVLAGCGNNNSSIIAGGEGIFEITFSRGEADRVNLILVAPNESEAIEFEDEIREDMIDMEIDATVTRDGKVITISMSYEDFAQLEGLDEESTLREDMIREFAEGWVPFMERGTGNNDSIVIGAYSVFEVTFRRGNVNRIIVTEQFWSEDSAMMEYEWLKEDLSDDARITLDGERVTIDMGPLDFNEFMGEDILEEGASRREIIDMLIENGFAVLK